MHLCPQQVWTQAQNDGEYRADSLETEGFIHCSRPEQILKVANRYFSGRQDLVLLQVDSEKLAADLRWEDSDGDVFPHLYGPLNLGAVISVVPISPDPEGVFRSLPKMD